MADYNWLDRGLHRVALGLRPVAELSFDLDQMIAKTDAEAVRDEAHVFVSGLARAGTTILMRRFHETGMFRSLTYRDMPFVLAPNLWKRIAGSAKHTAPLRERAHGDNILVSVDSPESLDEVFWRIFAGEDYIRSDRLVPHSADEQLRAKFARYVAAVLRTSGQSRYLSKNNNNILRLGSIRACFPHAFILVPFRDPAAHADSLLRQHRNFSAQQKADPFTRSYMDWLAHHEFGGGHLPFRFDDTDPGHDAETGDYWIDLWTRTYAWLLETAPRDTIFLSYDALCATPLAWQRIADMAGIRAAPTSQDRFRRQSRDVACSYAPELSRRADEVHEALLDRMDRALPGISR